MTAAEFVNRCDLIGGLYQGFIHGMNPKEIDVKTAPVDFIETCKEAYRVYTQFQECLDQYYDIVEDGEF